MGPPLAHPLDPRWTYLAQEADRIEAVFASVALAPPSLEHAPAAFYPLVDDAMPKAAETQPDFSGMT